MYGAYAFLNEDKKQYIQNSDWTFSDLLKGNDVRLLLLALKGRWHGDKVVLKIINIQDLDQMYRKYKDITEDVIYRLRIDYGINIELVDYILEHDLSNVKKCKKYMEVI